jgi:hypothetical protein
MSRICTSITSFISLIATANGYDPQILEAALEAFSRARGWTNRPALPTEADGSIWESRSSARTAPGFGIREPSRAFPFSQMKHGRSVVHVAALFGADPLQVKRAVKAIKEAEVNGIPASAHARLALAEKIGKILKPRNP